MLVQFYAVVPVASTTTDTKYISVSGGVEIYEGTTISDRTSGHINLIYGTQTAKFSGTCEGDIVIYWLIITDLKTLEMKTIGIGTFTGNIEVESGTFKSGTFTFTTVGRGSWLTMAFHNEWKIIGGTSGLSNIHGKGTFDGNLASATGSYSGSVFFRP